MTFYKQTRYTQRRLQDALSALDGALDNLGRGTATVDASLKDLEVLLSIEPAVKKARQEISESIDKLEHHLGKER